MDKEENGFLRFVQSVIHMIDAPVTYFREKIVEPNQKKYPWYHQKFRHVPTIDECNERDIACIQEAHYQFAREKQVEEQILHILRLRYEDCRWVNHGEDRSVCEDIYKTYEDAAAAWFAKYGDLGPRCHVIDAFMKQKHRLIWERRHGPVGSDWDKGLWLPSLYRHCVKESK